MKIKPNKHAKLLSFGEISDNNNDIFITIYNRPSHEIYLSNVVRPQLSQKTLVSQTENI